MVDEESIETYFHIQGKILNAKCNGYKYIRERIAIDIASQLYRTLIGYGYKLTIEFNYEDLEDEYEKLGDYN